MAVFHKKKKLLYLLLEDITLLGRIDKDGFFFSFEGYVREFNYCQKQVCVMILSSFIL